jgi:hypothetical protein
MNIVMVSSYDCFYPGGVGEHIRSLSAALRRRGHTVTVVQLTMAAYTRASVFWRSRS